jgi:hypothetical protein
MRIGAQGGLMHASCETQMPKWNPKNEKKVRFKYPRI